MFNDPRRGSVILGNSAVDSTYLVGSPFFNYSGEMSDQVEQSVYAYQGDILGNDGLADVGDDFFIFSEGSTF